MNLVIPTSRNDVALLGPLAEVFNHLGSCKGHTLIVCPADGAEQEANDFKQSVGHLFDRAVVRPTPINISGWPIAPNRHFREVCALMMSEYNNAPFWFFEPDCTPLRPGWLSAIDEAYKLGRQPFAGAIVPTRVTDGKGNHSTDGEHMVGCGIYPPDFYKRSQLMLALDRKMPFSPLPLEPFDVRVRFEVVPYALKLTTLQHNWRTLNYREKGGVIDCDHDTRNPAHTSHAKPVDPDALVVHGCRDSSLAKLVLDGTVERVFSEAPTKVVAVPAPAPAPAPVAAPVPEPEAPETPPATPVESNPVSDFEAHKIRKFVMAHPKTKYATIAKELGLDKDRVRDFVRSDRSGLRAGRGGMIEFVPAEDQP